MAVIRKNPNKTEKITANLLKKQLFKMFRLEKSNSRDLLCTEFGKFNADFAMVDLSGHNYIEVETKISKADLRNDLKKDKHLIYKGEKETTKNGIKFIPHKFYYCVPETMKDFALEIIDQVNSNYGLLVYKPGTDGIGIYGDVYSALSVEKNAEPIGQPIATPYLIRRIAKRASVEIYSKLNKINDLEQKLLTVQGQDYIKELETKNKQLIKENNRLSADNSGFEFYIKVLEKENKSLKEKLQMKGSN